MTSGPYRLPAPAGSLIDRARVVEFGFERHAYQGLAGDTVASALLANGVWMLSRSFKYRRPRGPLSLAEEEAGTLVQVGAEPNVPADTREIVAGMHIRGQNYMGSLRRDRLAILGCLGRFLPVGFYYKAFYKPRGAWNWWEKIIRPTAGLGQVDLQAPDRTFDKAYEFIDVAVIGGGPAGLAAASEAARAGAEVLLVERAPALGGSLTYARLGADGARGPAILNDLTRDLAAQPRVRTMTSAICTGWFTDNWLSVTRGTRLHKVRARSVVVCTGAIEQPAVFRNNDIPGVILGSAAQRLIRHYGVAPGRRALVLAANASGYGVALDLAEQGVKVAAIVDLRDEPAASVEQQAARDRGLRVIAGHAVREARLDRKRQRVGGALVTRITGEGECAPVGEEVACDVLCMSTGYSPAASLLLQADARFGYDEATAMFELESLPPHMFAGGAVVGVHDLDDALRSGRRAGWEAAAGCAAVSAPAPARATRDLDQSHPWPIFAQSKGKDFVDLDEDLTVADIRHSVAEGFTEVELIKRFSSLGMGPSQGRHSAVAGIRLTARETGQTAAAAGTTTSRPPAFPEKFGVLAGRRLLPVRHTPLHNRHIEAGSQLMVAGLWIRPAFYGPRERREASIRDEVRAVRQNVGLIDVSTLGGFEIRGPDAARFLERLHTLPYRRQPVGRVRYALLTDEAGVIVDDGVAARLAEQHFYVTASTSGAEQMYPRLLWHQAQWRLDVDIADVTSAFGAINLAGPQARAVLARLDGDINLSPAAFPYLGVRTGTVAGIRVRVLRIGFVGELGYELHAPWSQMEALWDVLMRAGADLAIRPFGVEAQRALRLEKGHIIVTQDTDALTHPLEAGMGWAIGRRTPYFEGKRAIEIMAVQGLTRQLVGYALRDAKSPLPAEGHLVVRGAEISGRVTSSAWSEVLQKAIGLAYVAPDQAEVGQVFTIKGQGGRLIEAEVVPLPFYDPKNERQKLSAVAGSPQEPAAQPPADPTRRSPILRRLEAAGASLGSMNGIDVVLDFGDVTGETWLARTLGLTDLSPLPRIGFKGPGALRWLSEQEVAIEDAPNRSWRQTDGTLAVARSHSEALVLSDLAARSDRCARLQAQSATAADARAYVLSRFDGLFWFALSGSAASACLAKLCGVDLRPSRFDDGAVAQTSVASLNMVVIRHDFGTTPAFYLLGDSASAEYFWDCLRDAMIEFDGGPVGLCALGSVASEFE